MISKLLFLTVWSLLRILFIENFFDIFFPLEFLTRKFFVKKSLWNFKSSRLSIKWKTWGVIFHFVTKIVRSQKCQYLQKKYFMHKQIQNFFQNIINHSFSHFIGVFTFHAKHLLHSFSSYVKSSTIKTLSS